MEGTTLSTPRFVFLWFVGSFLLGLLVAIFLFDRDGSTDAPTWIRGIMGAGIGVIVGAPLMAIALVARDVYRRRQTDPS